MKFLRDIQEKDSSFLRDRKIHKLELAFTNPVSSKSHSKTVYVDYKLDFQSLTLQRSRVDAYDDILVDDDELTSLWSKALPETLVPLEDH